MVKKVCILRSFLVINVCNQGNTLRSPCRFNTQSILVFVCGNFRTTTGSFLQLRYKTAIIRLQYKQASATTRPYCVISIQANFNFLRTPSISSALAKQQRRFLSFVMSVCPSVRINEFGFHWRDFHEILYLNFFSTDFRKILKFH